MYTIKWPGLEPNEEGWSPPSDTNVNYTGTCLHEEPSIRVVGDRDAELGVDLRLLSGICGLERFGDAVSLASVDHGARLIELRSVLDSRRGVGTGTWPDYVIESAELVVRRAARQGGALLALEVVGTENESGRSRPWTARIAVRRAENGRWLIVEVSERRSN